MARFGWQLLNLDDFAQRTYEHLCAGTVADALRGATYTYSQALYRACSGAEGAQRQNLGYTELFHYLYDHARWRYADVCEDATQAALERVFTSYERCRQPGAFFAFALQHLMDAAKVLRRQEDKHQRSLAAPLGEGEETLGEVLADPQEEDPAAQLIAQEQDQRLVQVAAEFVRAHPRAGKQLAALWLKHMEGLEEAAISRQLGKPIKSIYVLRSRAIAKLQDEAGWRALAVERGILSYA
jgi:RNA polymerase sigma factor (sigma-70 family)